VRAGVGSLVDLDIDLWRRNRRGPAGVSHPDPVQVGFQRSA